MAAGKEKPPVGATTEGQPNAVGANGDASFAHRRATGKADKAASNEKTDLAANGAASVAFRSSTGRIWRYTGKRGRVLAMLANSSFGVTQWDTLPWHTRLGSTIHAMRRDGLAIETKREGEFRHARYWLVTLGSLIKQGKNRERGA